MVPEDADGDVDLDVLERIIREHRAQVKLVALSHVATSSGKVYDVEAVGQITKQHGIPFLLDACQSVGQMPIDVQQIGCDFLSGTGRKYLRGPRGSGFLYASRKMQQLFEPAALDLHGAEWTSHTEYRMDPTAKRYELYEMSYAAKVGLGVAVDYALSLGMGAIWKRVQHLAGAMRRQLAASPRVTVRDEGLVRCGLVTFTLDGISPQAVKAFLSTRNINVHVSGKGSTLLDMTKRGLASVVRASVHYYNTEEEIGLLVGALREMAEVGGATAERRVSMEDGGKRSVSFEDGRVQAGRRVSFEGGDVQVGRRVMEHGWAKL